MVVKNRHYLPYRGEFDSKQQVLFTKKAKLKGMESLLVLPLVVREEPIGTLIVAAKSPSAFRHLGARDLQALANQLAVAMANARAVRQLEEMATTDGLTGCLNKRAFLDQMEQKLMAAQRFGRKLSLIVTDLDHFKAVNDTYGHAAGDRVLQELGRVLRAGEARDRPRGPLRRRGVLRSVRGDRRAGRPAAGRARARGAREHRASDRARAAEGHRIARRRDLPRPCLDRRGPCSCKATKRSTKPRTAAATRSAPSSASRRSGRACSSSVSGSSIHWKRPLPRRCSAGRADVSKRRERGELTEMARQHADLGHVVTMTMSSSSAACSRGSSACAVLPSSVESARWTSSGPRKPAGSRRGSRPFGPRAPAGSCRRRSIAGPAP